MVHPEQLKLTEADIIRFTLQRFTFKERGTLLSFKDTVYPGVDGYGMQTGRDLYFPVVFAQHEGDGSFSRMLADLKFLAVIGGYRINFPTVMSSKLESILFFHGYKRITEWDDDGPIRGPVEIWILDKGIHLSYYIRSFVTACDKLFLLEPKDKLIHIWRRNYAELKYGG